LTGIARTTLAVARTSYDAAAALPRIAFALESIAGLADDLRRLADRSDDLRRLADAGDELRRLLATASGDELLIVRETLQRVADTVVQLNRAVASLNTTVSPLQGASERLGRLVDRLPQGRATRRGVLDIEQGGPTE
jgi:ABC-type transporter Mla subunit MlaD